MRKRKRCTTGGGGDGIKEEEEEEDDGGAGLPKAPGAAVADVSTDEEGEEEVSQYETASDTGTE